MLYKSEIFAKKTQKFLELITDNVYDIFAFTESWLNKNDDVVRVEATPSSYVCNVTVRKIDLVVVLGFCAENTLGLSNKNRPFCIF